jgi:hypothetical protein
MKPIELNEFVMYDREKEMKKVMDILDSVLI